jgi:hypothetical protein
VNPTKLLFEFQIDWLREKADDFAPESEENDAMHDAADALADALDIC